jgi:predicted DNA-binding protein (MmcQ/YjbR family)
MNIQDLQNICKKFPGVKEDIKWENHLCFVVGEKMFLITSPDSFPVTASFKSDADNFEELTAREGFRPAPYLGRAKWVFVDDIRRLHKKEWEKILAVSYKLIAEKLPQKLKRKINI